MREILKTFIPRAHWSSTNVDIVPTTASAMKLAQWGGVGVFTAFWMIGTRSHRCLNTSCDARNVSALLLLGGLDLFLSL
ncbi:unnamed protein product [Bathycoccus prasinos]|uniref:Unnamed protein product n=1 Tax=Bathycoccus prasinos TaxID=41875 RepID=K8F795_9CHLO|nr:unnamed protein product [Bathycoccus prasinos]CCO20725.1 unnamed protein product [Bathycoccus prasinos]|eukprot:XP_007508234.1 unnamed protein product [Bathycoccus prasinos]